MIVLITKTIRPARLLDEVLAALPALVGALVQLVEDRVAGTYTLVVPDGTDANTLNTVIAAHDPTVLSVVEQQAQADADATAAFRLGWVLGQARLQGTTAGSIQSQMDAIQALTNAQALTGANVKTLSEAVEDIARQLFTLKRTVAIQADVPDR